MKLHFCNRTGMACFLLLAAGAAQLNANTITASSCARADVQTAVNGAAEGTTVVVPPGNCVWTTKVTVNKGISVRGSGMDVTVIDWRPNVLSNNAPFWIETNNYFSISHFTFTATGTKTDKGIIHYSGHAKDWQIHDNKFQDVDMKAIIHWGHSSGVIYKNQFLGAFKGMDINGIGDASWERSWTPGTGDTVFIEDNVFDQAFRYPSVGSHLGGRYTFRYNTVYRGGLSTHGADSSARAGGVIEAYGNHFTSDSDHDRAIIMRGGTALLFNNQFSGYASAISLSQYRTCFGVSWDSAHIANASRCDGTAAIDGNEARPGHSGFHSGQSSATLVDGAKSWQLNEFVGFQLYNLTDGSRCTITGNSATTVTCSLAGGSNNSWVSGDAYKVTSGWPCKDQVGRGPHQTSRPVYQWGNSWSRYGATPVSPGIGIGGYTCEDPGPSDQIRKSQDFFDGVIPPDYTPFPYPHPLRQGGPTAPQNLQITG